MLINAPSDTSPNAGALAASLYGEIHGVGSGSRRSECRESAPVLDRHRESCIARPWKPDCCAMGRSRRFDNTSQEPGSLLALCAHSSIGRAADSKSAGWVFESPCARPVRPGHEKLRPPSGGAIRWTTPGEVSSPASGFHNRGARGSRSDRHSSIFRKEARMPANKPGRKSKYQLKMRRKMGQGRIDPRWMWWFERGLSRGASRGAVEEEQRDTAEAAQ